MQPQEAGWAIFKSLCLKVESNHYLAQILDLLLTTEERENLAMRCLIVKELLAGDKTQRQIAKDLNVSIAKITRGSNELKRFDPKFLLTLKQEIVKK